jgi:hypothetical protein
LLTQRPAREGEKYKANNLSDLVDQTILFRIAADAGNFCLIVNRVFRLAIGGCRRKTNRDE